MDREGIESCCCHETSLRGRQSAWIAVICMRVCRRFRWDGSLPRSKALIMLKAPFKMLENTAMPYNIFLHGGLESQPELQADSRGFEK
jgi:hypothetical protein